MHSPLAGSHANGALHWFSRLPQRATHCPLKQTSPAMGQVAPLSIVPLQSSSSPLHASGCGWRTPWQTGAVAPAAHSVIPSAQIPSFPVLQTTPAPLHSTPSTAATRSVKSALVVSNVSSQAK